MQLTIRIKKGKDGPHSLVCTRADGTMTMQHQTNGFFPVHDLMHYAVETAFDGLLERIRVGSGASTDSPSRRSTAWSEWRRDDRAAVGSRKAARPLNQRGRRHVGVSTHANLDRLEASEASSRLEAELAR